MLLLIKLPTVSCETANKNKVYGSKSKGQIKNVNGNVIASKIKRTNIKSKS